MIGRARLKRLRNDHEQLMALHKRHGLIYVVAAEGNPPERYIVGFRCRGVARIESNDQPVYQDEHRVDLILTANYPRIRPFMEWTTPIFHPNFGDDGSVCIKEWYPQQTLSELCIVLAEMVQYKNYNTTSPLNMDAAMWAMRHRNELPTDKRNLFTPVNSGSTPAAVAQSVYQRSAVVMGTLPILPEQPVATPAEPTIAARFCRICRFEFVNADTRFCPACGTARRIS